MNDPSPPKKNYFIRQDLNFAQGGVTLRQGLARIGLRKALRRSIFITLWKRLLPFVALIIISVVLSWPYMVPEENKFRIEAQDAPNYLDQQSLLIGLKFVGTDEQNQTYSISSSRAEQSNDKSGKIILTRPTGDLNMSNKGWFYLASEQGVFFSREKKIVLEGKVSIHNSEGFELHTESLAVDLNSHNMDAQLPVVGQSPGLSLAAEGMRIRERGALLELLGSSKVTVRSDDGGAGKGSPLAGSDSHGP